MEDSDCDESDNIVRNEHRQKGVNQTRVRILQRRNNLGHDYEQLKPDHEELKQENEELKQENEGLKQENERLKQKLLKWMASTAGAYTEDNTTVCAGSFLL